MTEDEPQKSVLSKEDQDLWDQFIHDRDTDPHPEEDFASLLDAHEKEEKPSKEIKKQFDTVLVEKSETQVKKSAAQPAELDRRTAQKLQKGKIIIEARLDLHGLNQQQAHSRLIDFIFRSIEEKLRCLLVITGKGKSRITTNNIFDREEGVLKHKLPMWLSEKKFSDHILKIVPAHKKDGGSGAFYIYLKRQR